MHGGPTVARNEVFIEVPAWCLAGGFGESFEKRVGGRPGYRTFAHHRESHAIIHIGVSKYLHPFTEFQIGGDDQ